MKTDEVADMIMEIGDRCSVVLACRVSPK